MPCGLFNAGLVGSSASNGFRVVFKFVDIVFIHWSKKNLTMY
jgi:hypothetical protein